MYLKSESYVEPEVETSTLSAQKKTAIKNKIKALVPSGKKLYKEVIDAIEQEYVEAGEHLKSDDILALVKEVELEWHPPVEVTLEEPVPEVTK